MNNLILEDKHFVRHQRIFKFMKTFYEKYKTFDIQLMFAICKDKYQIIEYLQMLVCNDVEIENFEKYQKMILELIEENKKDKWVIEKIYNLANELYIRKINCADFDMNYKKILEDANKIFKNEKEV